MDNREFSKILLSEAAELLNEAGAREKYLKSLGDKQDKDIKKIKENEEKIGLEKDKRELYGKDSLKSYVDTAKMSAENKFLDARQKYYKKKAQKYSGRIIDDDYDTRTINEQLKDKKIMHGDWARVEKDRKAKEKFNKDFGGEKKDFMETLIGDTDNIHTRMKKRIESKKAQNESIAILLTEAALLLND